MGTLVIARRNDVASSDQVHQPINTASNPQISPDLSLLPEREGETLRPVPLPSGQKPKAR